MKSKFKKLLAAALVLCLVLALLPAAVFATDGDVETGADTPDPVTNLDPGNVDTEPQDPSEVTFTYENFSGNDFENDGNGYAFGKIEVVSKESGGYKLTATPDDGYGLSKLKISVLENDVKITVDAGSTFIYEFSVPSETTEVTITASFNKVYSVSVSDGMVGGDVTADKYKAFADDTVTLTVTPIDGFAINGDGVVVKTKDETTVPVSQIVGNKCTFTMPSDNVYVSATFMEVPPVIPAVEYSVTCMPADNGTVYQPNQKYEAGETVTITAVPNDGYQLKSMVALYNGYGGHYVWSEVITDDQSFVMPGFDVVVYTVFEPIKDYEYDINVDVSGNCQVSRPVTAAPGELVEISINVDNGYHLLYVKVDGDYVTDSLYWADGKWNYSFYMPWHDVDIYVATTDKLFVNTVYDINGGAVEVWVKDSVSDKWDSTIFADADDWVCFKATPYSGYDVGSVSVTGRWYGNAYDVEYFWRDGCYYFKMPYESVNLSVSFVDKGHKVTVKDVTNGSLSVNTKWAVEDERVYITAVPDKGYELTWLYVKAADGSSVKVYEAIKEDTYYFFMPDQEVTVSAIFAYDYPDMPFIDVNPNSWYYSAIEFVYNKGIMNGVTASSFNPDGTITRGMIVTMLWRMAGEPSAVSAGFADVAADSYYAKAIAWAAKNGIIEGYSASSFGPNDAITREQLATVLYRYAKYLGYTTTGSSLSGYYDASRVSSWAKDAMGWAVKNGVVTGLSSTWLNPNGTASRAEAAQMFMNFYEFLG